MDQLLVELTQNIEADVLLAQATVLAGPNPGAKLLLWPDGRTQGNLGSAELDRRVVTHALELLEQQRTERCQFDIADERYDIFIEVFASPPHLIIVGAVHMAIPLVSLATLLGFRTTVIDARTAFATPDRFAHADHLIVGWPDEVLANLKLNESSYVAVLSHDDKLDVPALAVALHSPARYIGALGSRKTMARRAERLRELDATDEQLARIHNPIGLDLGGRSAEEMALAILAEIVAVRNGRV